MQAIGVKKGAFMRKHIKRNKVQGTYGIMEPVKDFLPRPEDLVLKSDELVKVTIQLNKSSIDYFKQEARRLGGNYQTMIRNLLDYYATKQKS